MIVPVGKGKYVVKSEDGKKTLSKPLTMEAAKRRLQQIEMFKALAGKKTK